MARGSHSRRRTGRRPKHRPSTHKSGRRPYTSKKFTKRTQSKVVPLSTILNKRAPKTLEEARIKGFENVVRENELAAFAQNWEHIHATERARISAGAEPVPSRIYLIEKHIQERVRDDLKSKLPPGDPRRPVGLEISPQVGYRQETLKGNLHNLWHRAHSD